MLPVTPFITNSKNVFEFGFMKYRLYLIKMIPINKIYLRLIIIYRSKFRNNKKISFTNYFLHTQSLPTNILQPSTTLKSNPITNPHFQPRNQQSNSLPQIPQIKRRNLVNPSDKPNSQLTTTIHNNFFNPICITIK